MKIKILSMFLSLVMVVILVSNLELSVSAAREVGDYTDRQGLRYRLYDDKTATVIGSQLREEIIIPEKVNGYTVTRIGIDAVKVRSRLIISKTVEVIEYYAISGMEYSVIFLSGSNLREVEQGGFYGNKVTIFTHGGNGECDRIKELVRGYWNLGMSVVDHSAFYDEKMGFDGTKHWYDVKCTECGFGKKVGLEEHNYEIVSKDGGEVHTCKTCNKKFFYKNGLKYELESSEKANVVGVTKNLSGLVVIPEKVAGRTVKKLKDGAFDEAHCSEVSSIEIPKGVRCIEENSLKGCKSLNKIIMAPNSDLSNGDKLGTDTFGGTNNKVNIFAQEKDKKQEKNLKDKFGNTLHSFLRPSRHAYFSNHSKFNVESGGWNCSECSAIKDNRVDEIENNPDKSDNLVSDFVPTKEKSDDLVSDFISTKEKSDDLVSDFVPTKEKSDDLVSGFVSTKETENSSKLDTTVQNSQKAVISANNFKTGDTSNIILLVDAIILSLVLCLLITRKRKLDK